MNKKATNGMDAYKFTESSSVKLKCVVLEMRCVHDSIDIVMTENY